MTIQIMLTIWLLVLIFLTARFRQQGKIRQQRILSIFLIVWAFLAIAYYDVWTYTSGVLEAQGESWQTYLPAVFFSICAGVGTYYLMMTFRKFREIGDKADAVLEQEKKEAQERKASKKAGKNKK